MTEQQISRTQAWLESYDLKPSPSPLLQLSSGQRWHHSGNRTFDPLVALLALITAPGYLQEFLLTSPMITAMR